MSKRKGVDDGKRGKNFSTLEIETLLTILEESLPFGENEWTVVHLNFNQQMRRMVGNSYVEREVSSLKTKYKNMKSVAKPTGEPMIHPLIARAKRIAKDIENRQCVTTLNDEGFEVEDTNEDIDLDDDEIISNPLVTPPSNSSSLPTISSRVGLSYEQLKTMSASSVSTSESVLKRQKVDGAIGKVMSFMETMMKDSNEKEEKLINIIEKLATQQTIQPLSSTTSSAKRVVVSMTEDEVEEFRRWKEGDSK